MERNYVGLVRITIVVRQHYRLPIIYTLSAMTELVAVYALLIMRCYAYGRLNVIRHCATHSTPHAIGGIPEPCSALTLKGGAVGHILALLSAIATL